MPRVISSEVMTFWANRHCCCTVLRYLSNKVMEKIVVEVFFGAGGYTNQGDTSVRHIPLSISFLSLFLIK